MSAKPALQEALDFLKTHRDIATIDLLVPDNNGVLRGKRVQAEYLADVYENGISMPGSVFAMDIAGNTVESTGLGFDEGDLDRVCYPVSDTLVPVPWRGGGAAQVLMTMSDIDGAPFFADPRQVLDRVMSRFDKLGLRPSAAVELEFYLVDRNATAEGLPQAPIGPNSGRRQSTTQVYGMTELDEFSRLFDDIIAAAREQGLPAESVVAEYAPGQYEVNLKYRDDALRACDDAVMLKRLVKAIAQKHGFEATFMAKLYADQSGNGTHIHVSLLDNDGSNVFRGADHFGSETLRHAIGGLMDTMGESMAICAPNANSYKRLQSDAYVPMAPNWGFSNRTVAVRIPSGSDQARRLEHRVAGADANPYLLMAAVLSGIHHGISNRIDPGSPTSGNAYEQQEASLPTTWLESMQAFEESQVLMDYLGDDFCRVFSACKKEEREAFNRHISALEYRWYLHTV